MAVTTSPPGASAASRPVWRRPPSLRLQRAFAWAAVITNGLIAVTGATVRVTGSGLGCPTWPECVPGSLVPVSRADLSAFHLAIEFGNRTLTSVVLIASFGTFAVIWLARPRRSPLVTLSAVLPAGVIFQAIWGGIVVLTGLSWWTVAPHLLISLLLLYVSIAVLVRLDETDDPPVLVVPRPLQLLTWATMGVLIALCVAGTLVTAAGPHGGDEDTPRLDLPVRVLAQLHADLMFTYFGLLVAMTVGFLAVKAPRKLMVRAVLLIAVTAAQAMIGLVQYATGVPEALVVAHVLGATLLVAAAASVVLATRTRGRAASDPVPANPLADGSIQAHPNPPEPAGPALADRLSRAAEQ